MGADSFVATYGIKIALDPDDEEELDACDTNADPRCQAASRVGLESFTGRMTDGEDYFLYIGKQIARLGIEHDQYSAQSIEQLLTVVGEVNTKLKTAGFSQPPEFHFQFIGQY